MAPRLRLAAAALLGATAGLVGFTTSAQAAACPAGTGVTVVVNSSVGCDRNGGGSAASNFGDAGHSLTYAAKEPGFVCRVDGSPASDPCGKASPADAYWGLFWSDGTSGRWVYSSSGVGSLHVPTGGWVAFVFQSSSTTRYPGVRPVTAAPPKAGGGSSGGSGSSGGGSSSGSSSTSSAKTRADVAKAKARAKAKKDAAKASATPTPSASASAGDAGSSSDDIDRTSQQTEPGSSVPWWAGAGLAVLLAGAAGLVAWRRRAQRDS